MGKKRGGAYYYAGGEKVELTPADDLVAVEGGPKDVGRALTGGLRLLTKEEHGALPKSTGGASSDYPVFRYAETVMVAMPEVRVEDSRAKKWSQIDAWLKSHADEVEVVSRDDDRVSLKPKSGSGTDALALANDLMEEVGPEAAHPNFLRITPRPKT